MEDEAKLRQNSYQTQEQSYDELTDCLSTSLTSVSSGSHILTSKPHAADDNGGNVTLSTDDSGGNQDRKKERTNSPVSNSNLRSENHEPDAVSGGRSSESNMVLMGNSCEEKENESRDDVTDNNSDISDFSDLSQDSWQPVQGPIAWVQDQMRQGQSPRKILEDLVPSGTMIPEGLDSIMLWKIIINIVSEPPKRKKLHDINTLDDVLHLLKTCQKIIVLTGAGVSVSCGIPDFRSRDGVYARLAKDFPNLPDPQAMFDIHFFRNDPRPFFKFAKEIYPGQFQPSLCHRFIQLLEEKGKLLRNYTQNIDTLEQVAGIQRVVQCHGSFASATCTVCGHKVDSDAIKDDIFNQVIPSCPECSDTSPGSVMKPDIVFFGESLPELFHNMMAVDKDVCDLLIVIGSSLKVRPVALIPNSLPAHIPQILINRERLHYLNFDVELLGNCDDIIGELCRRLGSGWENLASKGLPLKEVAMSALPTPPTSPPQELTSSQKGGALNWVPTYEEMAHQNLTECSSLQQGGDFEADNWLSETSVQQASTSQESLDSSNISKGVGKSHFHFDAMKQVSSVKCEKSCSERKKSMSSFHPSEEACDRVPSSSQSDLDGEHLTSNMSAATSEAVENLVSACHKQDVLFLHTTQATTLSSSDSSPHSSKHSSLNRSSDELTSASKSDRNHNHHHHHHHHHCSTSELHEPHLKKTEKQPVIDSSAHPYSSDSTTEKLLECGDEGEPSVKKRKVSREPDSSIEKEEEENHDSNSQDSSLDDIRKMWQSKRRVSLANRLADDQVLFLPPSRYVFKGAEVFSESESESSDDEDDDDDDEDEDGNISTSEKEECAVGKTDHTSSFSPQASTSGHLPCSDNTDCATSSAPLERITFSSCVDRQEERVSPSTVDSMSKPNATAKTSQHSLDCSVSSSDSSSASQPRRDKVETENHVSSSNSAEFLG